MDAIYVCSVLRIHFFMHLSNYAPFVCLSSLACARVHLYISVCTYMYVFRYVSRGFWGLGLGPMLLMCPSLLEPKATDCGETCLFCSLSQHWFLYLQIFQPEEPTSYTSTICHPVTSSSRKAALGEGICVGTGKSAGEDLGIPEIWWFCS